MNRGYTLSFDKDDTNNATLALSCAMCLDCGEVLVSLDRHDFVSCSCPNKAFVDGGAAYVRCGAMDMQQLRTFAIGLKLYRDEDNMIIDIRRTEIPE